MIVFTANKTQKLLKAALENADVSYSALNKALRNKDVKVNDKRVKTDVYIKAGDTVKIYLPENDGERIEKFRVIYKDNDITVVDKKRGVLSEDVFAELSGNAECYFIHRLDRNTDGIMIFANNRVAEEELKKGFKTRAFEKNYIAEVKGVPKPERAECSAFLFKDAKRGVVTVTENKVKGAVPIKTGYKVIKNNGETSVLRIKLFTGKTHQIRAHLAFLGYPVVGDEKYGDHAFNKSRGVKKQMLTASELVLHFDSDSPLYRLDGKIFVKD